LRQHGLRMVQQQFKPVGPAKYQVKDTLAKTLGLELPVLRVVDKLYADMVAHGDGELDHSGIIREISRAQGLPVRSAHEFIERTPT
jgi:3-hydroxyisobutyrate dehydrogenase-like beta-hydroxyacid dehydrogenase